MRIEYIREMKRSYMTVTGEGVGESYETGMLAKNQISGLLKMKIKYMDGVPVYCYDITSRQPVSRLFESRPAGENQVRSFFLQLYETLDRMEAYLLGDGGILLDPELIYADPETFQMGFCVVPGRKEDFSSQLSLFLQYLMKNIDHRDRECVVLTYGLYQTSMKYNYGMEDMMALLSKEEEKDLKTEKDLLMERKGDGKTEKGLKKLETSAQIKEFINGNWKESEVSLTTNEGEGSANLTVINTVGKKLPVTGSSAAVICITTGSVLVLAGAMRRNRKNAKEKQ